MSVVIGIFYKTEAEALEKIKRLHAQYGNHRKYCLLCGSKGVVIITEAQARKLRPDMFPKARYTKRNLKNNDLLRKKGE